MPKNKCEDCSRPKDCGDRQYRLFSNPLFCGQCFIFIPKTYIAEKEYLNQWEEKDETNI